LVKAISSKVEVCFENEFIDLKKSLQEREVEVEYLKRRVGELKKDLQRYKAIEMDLVKAQKENKLNQKKFGDYDKKIRQLTE